jgi:hypothetical protein
LNKVQRRLLVALAASYLGLQIALPLWVATRPGFAVRDFSWDMFSHRLSCEKLELRARVPAGPWFSVPLHTDFGSWAQLARVLEAHRLAAYARYRCDRLKIALRSDVELHILATCREDASEPTTIADPGRDYCVVTTAQADDEAPR